MAGGADGGKAVSQGAGLYVGKQIEARFSGSGDLPMSSSDSNSSLISSLTSDSLGDTGEVSVEDGSGDMDVVGVGSCGGDFEGLCERGRQAWGWGELEVEDGA